MVWRQAAAACYLLHHALIRGSDLAVAYLRATAIAQVMGLDPPELGRTWFLPKARSFRALNHSERAVEALEFIEQGVCAIFNHRLRTEDPFFRVPDLLYRTPAEGVRLGLFLADLMPIDMAGQSSLQAADLDAWLKDLIFEEPGAGRGSIRCDQGRHIYDLTDIEADDARFRLGRPIVIEDVAYADSLGKAGRAILRLLAFDYGQYPTSVDDLSRLLKSLWWLPTREPINVSVTVRCMDCAALPDVIALRDAINGDWPTAWGAPLTYQVVVELCT